MTENLSILQERKADSKSFDLVGPKQTDVLLKNQLEIQKVLEEEEYRNLQVPCITEKVD